MEYPELTCSLALSLSISRSMTIAKKPVLFLNSSRLFLTPRQDKGNIDADLCFTGSTGNAGLYKAVLVSSDGDSISSRTFI